MLIVSICILLQDPVSECIKRNTQELEELQKEQNKKLENLERKNENAVATLIKDNEKIETLMRAKHFAEERAARIAVELKAARIAFLSNKPPAPECPVCIEQVQKLVLSDALVVFFLHFHSVDSF